VNFDVRCFEDYIVNLSLVEERSISCESDEFRNEIYHRIEDEFFVVMKSKSYSGDVGESDIEHEISKLINLRHPCIAATIGFVFGLESGNRRELKIVRMYLEGCSLSEVISMSPVWWTSTVKAKTIAGIVFGLRFAHSHRLLHGHLTGNNVLFDSDHNIQIVDFNGMVLEVGERENQDGTQLVNFSGERLTRERDIQGFSSILFELVFGYPPQDESSIPSGIPYFVCKMIKSGFSPVSRISYSFDTILEILKEHDFQIESGVDSAEMATFVNWIDSTGYPG
jgi:serine/threonine protein kinase